MNRKDREVALVFDRRALAVGAFILIISLIFVDDDSKAFTLISNTASSLIGGVLGLLREAEKENEDKNEPSSYR